MQNLWIQEQIKGNNFELSKIHTKENMADSKEKLAEADESLRNIAEDLRCIHGVCARVKKGLKSASQANPRGV